MATDSIFLSYSRKDEVFAKRIASSLKQSEINIWFDQTDIPKGASWDNEIEKALKNCHTVIFVLSKDSVKSNNVQDEISYALEENKKIVPLKIAECEIPFRIRRKQYIDFTTNEEEATLELYRTLGTSSIGSLPVTQNRWKKAFTKRILSLMLLLLMCIGAISYYLSTLRQTKITIPVLPDSTVNIRDTIKNPQVIDSPISSPIKSKIIVKAPNEIVDSNRKDKKELADGYIENMPFKSEFHDNTLYYNGNIKDMKPNGLGQLFYQTQKERLKIFAGNFENGKAVNGKIWSTPDFDSEGEEMTNYLYYDGELVSGKPNGYGKKYNDNYDLIYMGYFKDGQYDGKGKLYANNNLKYDGSWALGKPHGFGIFYTTKSTRLEANLKNGILNGSAKIYQSNKLLFDGIYFDDHSSNGIMYYDNGDKYQGDFKDGKRMGYGTIIRVNGEKYIGNWLNDKQHGEGKLYNSSGKLLQEGFWDNGIFQN